MLKVVKVIDEQTKLCEVGIGTDEEYYKSIGMELREVEQAYNGNWYLKGYAPKQPLEELKSQQKEEINQARDSAEQGGFEYKGKMFDSDQVSCQRISIAAQAMANASDDATITWTCQDNTTVDLNKTQLAELVAALAAWSNTCHQRATELKAQIDAAQTVEEVEKITWSDQD